MTGDQADPSAEPADEAPLFSTRHRGDAIVRERPPPTAAAVRGLAAVLALGLGGLAAAGHLLFGRRLREVFEDAEGGDELSWDGDDGATPSDGPAWMPDGLAHVWGALEWLAGTNPLVPLALLLVGSVAAVGCHYLAARLSGRQSVGTSLTVSVFLLGLGGGMFPFAHLPRLFDFPTSLALLLPGTVLAAGGVTVALCARRWRDARRVQRRYRELRATGRRVPGRLDAVAFHQRWTGRGHPMLRVRVSYPAAGPDGTRVWADAHLVTRPGRVPRRGTRLWVTEDAQRPDPTDLLIELDRDAPIRWETDTRRYRAPNPDGGSGG
ncbi:hypothetical protein RM844_05235 [Streptomyces sp. DSM 44915]|uniref:Integral membrane protein n=1 Tax=Streptomyces chisholmiae TaxID=3075540 RepID=A0ABU2JL30_9ACTN|nr:hypothetical protein [Streptomyces sp. DSM 44915]MDT0265692.1 hypothetical protein [Streptomyces sp. DSM 44915]